MSAALLSVLALWLILVPLRAERYMFLAANALRNKQTAYAAAMLEKQIALTPKRPEPWAMLGPLYGMMSESVSDPAQKQALLKKSLRTLEHADVLCPNYRNVRRNIAAALSRLGKTREAIKVLERAAKVQDASWLYADMARNYVTLGDLAAAEASARKAVQESSKDPEHIHLLGYVLAREGKKLEAIEQFKMASALEPEAARNYVAMGYAYVDIGRRQEGIAALRKALGLAVPGSSDERLAEGGLTRLGQPLVPQ
jgi:tetratricopeptide (TPR) repeat protein